MAPDTFSLPLSLTGTGFDLGGFNQQINDLMKGFGGGGSSFGMPGMGPSGFEVPSVYNYLNIGAGFGGPHGSHQSQNPFDMQQLSGMMPMGNMPFFGGSMSHALGMENSAAGGVLDTAMNHPFGSILAMIGATAGMKAAWNIPYNKVGTGLWNGIKPVASFLYNKLSNAAGLTRDYFTLKDWSGNIGNKFVYKWASSLGRIPGAGYVNRGMAAMGNYIGTKLPGVASVMANNGLRCAGAVLGRIAGPIGVGLGLYESFQAGKSGSWGQGALGIGGTALSGAIIGSTICPFMGTIIGGLIGGAAGAISSWLGSKFG